MELNKDVRNRFEEGKNDTSIADYVVSKKISEKQLERLAGKFDQDIKYLIIGFSWRNNQSERFREHVYAGACQIFEDNIVFQDPLFFDQGWMGSTIDRGFEMQKGHPVVEISHVIYAYLLEKQ